VSLHLTSSAKSAVNIATFHHDAALRQFCGTQRSSSDLLKDTQTYFYEPCDAIDAPRTNAVLFIMRLSKLVCSVNNDKNIVHCIHISKHKTASSLLLPRQEFYNA
jgi:hypothetical protein